MLAELFPRRMFFNVFHEVFISTKYDEAIEACKAELQDQVNREALNAEGEEKH